MRSTGNFSPEWGYLAPAPSVLRTMRVVLVATAIGATAGAGVVLSLVDHSAADGDKVAVAAHAIVTSVQAVPVQAPAMSELKVAPDAASKTMPAIAAVAVAPVAPTPVQNAALAAPQIQTPQVQAATPQPDHAAPTAALAVPAQDTSRSATGSAAPASTTNDTAAAGVPQQPAVAALSDPNVATPVSPVASTDAAGDQGYVGPQQTAQQKKTKHHNANYSRDFPPVIGPALRHLFSARAGTTYYPNRAY